MAANIWNTPLGMELPRFRISHKSMGGGGKTWGKNGKKAEDYIAGLMPDTSYMGRPSKASFLFVFLQKIL